MRWEIWRKLDYFRIVQKELIWTDEVYDMWHNKVLRNNAKYDCNLRLRTQQPRKPVQWTALNWRKECLNLLLQRTSVTYWCSFNENSPQRIICSNIWSPVCGTVCSRLGGVALLEEMFHWRQASCFPLCPLLTVCWRCESTVSAVMIALQLRYGLYHSGTVNPIKCVPWWISLVIFIFLIRNDKKK